MIYKAPTSIKNQGAIKMLVSVSVFENIVYRFGFLVYRPKTSWHTQTDSTFVIVMISFVFTNTFSFCSTAWPVCVELIQVTLSPPRRAFEDSWNVTFYRPDALALYQLTVLY